MREASIQSAIRLAAAKMGIVLFRNNVGTLQDRNGQYVRYGLCIGSSDLIGYMPNGIFIAIEVKTPKKKATAAQMAFLLSVITAGGIGLCCTSVDEFISEMKARLV